MLFESNFRNPLLYPVMILLNAVRVPDLEQVDVEARRKAEQAVHEVIEGLKRGETHIMWPAGHVYRQEGRENLGGARALTDILRAVPNLNVVLVRTRGVWGSSFTFAWT